MCAPSGPPDPGLLERGVAELEGLGFEVVVPDGILERHAFTAGSAERRLTELAGLFEDAEIAAVFAARGGAGAIGLLPQLDVGRLTARPKPFVGYSDLTFLHVLLNNAGVVSLHGPMVARELADANYDRESLLAALCGDAEHAVNEVDDLLALREGAGQGRLLGGCLSILCAGLGTSWALRLPEDEKVVLFLEDLNEAPYRVDRMLRQLRAALPFERVGGIVLGEMAGCWPEEDGGYALEDVVREALSGLEVPIALGLPSGHCPRGVTLPLGAEARLECGGEAGRFELLEAGVA